MKIRGLAFPLLALTVSAAACAKKPAAAPPAPAAGTTASAQAPLPVPEVGSKAPDFKFTPVTTAGIGKATKLSALKGQTTVVWFFPKARTRG